VATLVGVLGVGVAADAAEAVPVVSLAPQAGAPLLVDVALDGVLVFRVVVVVQVGDDRGDLIFEGLVRSTDAHQGLARGYTHRDAGLGAEHVGVLLNIIGDLVCLIVGVLEQLVVCFLRTSLGPELLGGRRVDHLHIGVVWDRVLLDHLLHSAALALRLAEIAGDAGPNRSRAGSGGLGNECGRTAALRGLRVQGSLAGHVVFLLHRRLRACVTHVGRGVVGWVVGVEMGLGRGRGG